MNILIPMAGRGLRTRDFSNKPKPLIDINGKTMIEWAVKTLDIKGQYIFVTRKYNEKLDKELNDILESVSKDPKIIQIDYITEGPACSALLAKEYINNEEELIIANSDQILEWDSKKFLKAISREDIDGLVVTWDNIAPTESYIELDKRGFGIRLKEKEIISNYPLNGIHYWKKGKYFIESTEELIKRDIRTNGEFYISETYNILIEQGARITNHHISKKEHHAVGLAKDIKNYLKEKNEFI